MSDEERKTKEGKNMRGALVEVVKENKEKRDGGRVKGEAKEVGEVRTGKERWRMCEVKEGRKEQ